MTRHVTQAPGSGRNDGSDTLRYLLVLNDRQSTVHFLLLRFEGGCGNRYGCGSQECAAGSIYLLCIHRLSGSRFFLLATKPETDNPVLAGADTIHTRHTTAVVYPMFLPVDARRLAFARAESAAVAFTFINRDAKQGKNGTGSRASFLPDR